MDERARFEQKHFERQQLLAERSQKRKEDVKNSEVDAILRQSTELLSSIQHAMDENSNNPLIVDMITDAEAYLTSTASSLPNYHIRRFKEELSNFRGKLSSTASSLKGISDSTVRVISEPQRVPLRPGSKRLRGLFFTNEENSIIQPDRDTTKNYPLVLENLSNCTIEVSSSLASLRVSNLSNCVLCIGPVQGSSHITDCTSCKFTLATHQLRIHKTIDSSFYCFLSFKPHY
ncbi:hypothetical protein GEMRC1_011116 [Eukaryota sp. GEM-RC1]